MNNNVSCAQVMSAATAIRPREDHRITALLIAFAGYCGDKQSAVTAFQELDLSPYALSSVLIYYVGNTANKVLDPLHVQKNPML